MATPSFQMQSATANIAGAGTNNVTIPTKDSSGATVNVSSGYSLASVLARPAQNTNVDGGSVQDVTANVSAAFTATGVTLTLDNAALNGALPTLNSNLVVNISNDSGTTHSPIGVIALTINNYNGLL